MSAPLILRLRASAPLIHAAILVLVSTLAPAYGATQFRPVAAAKFSIPGGVYTNDLSLQLTADGSTIRYTLDGSEPGVTSTVYTAAIPLTNCAIVRARVWEPDGRRSATTTQSYILLANDLLQFNSNLPILILRSASGEIVAPEKTLSSLRIFSTNSSAPRGRASLRAAPNFDGLALVNIRGHSSLRYPKHSYNLKLINELQDPHKASLLDLPKESDWALYGPYPDKTLMRDVLAYQLSNDMGRWAPRTRFVELFVSEAPSKLSMEEYVGVYILEEKVTRDKNRVNIAKLERSALPSPGGEGQSEGGLGGYIFKKDHTSSFERKLFDPDGPPQAGTSTNRAGYPTPPGGFPGDPAGFFPSYAGKTTSNRVTRTAAAAPARPKKSKVDPNRPRTNHVAGAAPGTVKLKEQLIFHDDEGFRTQLQRNQFYFFDPEPDEITGVQRAWLKDYLNRFEAALYGPAFRDKTYGYPAFIDPLSFIDQHLLIEITKNVDGFRFSAFYHKDRNGLLQMGPAWDWNLSFGNADGKQGYLPDHWLWPQLDDQQYSWFRRLFEDPDFAQRYVDRWSELRGTVFATSNVLAKIEHFAELLNEAQQRNFARWEIMGREINPNYFVGNSYREEIEWMKSWTTNRLSWIDAQFIAPPQIRAGASGSVEITSTAAKIYFTTDGSDPRSSGGSPSPGATLYAAPLSLSPQTKVCARALNDSRWSASTTFPRP